MVPLLFASKRELIALVLCVAAVAAGVALLVKPSSSKATETVYVVNHSQGFISDRTILRDIPAWEQAANVDFSPVWNSAQVKIELVKRVPKGGISAVFVKDGPVQGALAYHTVYRGAPQIIVYAGTGAYYGYSNSVSFTHELFELLGDPEINSWNWHWQSNPFYFYVGQRAYALPPGAFWFNEVCDPVEAYSYSVDGVAISDFVTPAWFGDGTNGGYDQMNVVHEPLQTLRGGYSQFIANGQYQLVQFFRGAGRDAAGFLKGERTELK